MADNSTLPVAVGTEVFANKDIGPGVKYPRVQVVWGGLGVVNDTDTATGKGLPIQGTIAVSSIAGTVIVNGSGVTQPISGAVSVTGAVTVNGIPTTALTRGVGVADVNTQRVTIDTAQTPITVLQGTNNGGRWQIEGTIGGAAQTPVVVSGTIQPGNTPNTTPWLVNSTAAWDKTIGTGGSFTQRVSIDTSQTGQLLVGAVPTVSGGYQYRPVAANVTGAGQVLQTIAGAIGDYIEGILCVVATAANSQVMIGDGVTPALVVLPNNVGAGVGSYYIPLGFTSTGGSWRVATATGVSIIATGKFS